MRTNGQGAAAGGEAAPVKIDQHRPLFRVARRGQHVQHQAVFPLTLLRHAKVLRMSPVEMGPQSLGTGNAAPELHGNRPVLSAVPHAFPSLRGHGRQKSPFPFAIRAVGNPSINFHAFPGPAQHPSGASMRHGPQLLRLFDGHKFPPLKNYLLSFNYSIPFSKKKETPACPLQHASAST